MFQILVVIVGVLSQHAWAATAVTPIKVSASTNTYCPRFSPTPFATPASKASVCGGTGVLSKPQKLKAYCGPNIPGLGDITNDRPVYRDIICYRACVLDPACQSFSVDFANDICYTYGQSVAAMGFRSDSNVFEFFWDIRGCYQCFQPAPAVESVCPPTLQPKAQEPAGFLCNATGDADQSLTAFYYYYNDYNRTLGPRPCYETCVREFQAVGACESFALWNPSNSNDVGCWIYDGSLRAKNFIPKPDGDSKGWNVRGCFQCNATTTTSVPTCTPTPTATPARVGVRNGGFQRTHFNKTIKKLLPDDWDKDEFGDGSAISQPNNKSNTVLNLPCSRRKDGSGYYSSFGQEVYGLNGFANGTRRYYNFSFDLAIPFVSAKVKDPSHDDGCTLYAPGLGYDSNYRNPRINVSEAAYRGTTLKPYGPYSVPFERQHIGEGLSLSFEAYCSFYLGGVPLNATFWVDNFRIVDDTGKEVGAP